MRKFVGGWRVFVLSVGVSARKRSLKAVKCLLKEVEELNRLVKIVTRKGLSSQVLDSR